MFTVEISYDKYDKFKYEIKITKNSAHPVVFGSLTLDELAQIRDEADAFLNKLGYHKAPTNLDIIEREAKKFHTRYTREKDCPN